MKSFATIIVFLNVILLLNAQEPNFDWARNSGGAFSQVSVQGIAVDSDANVYSTGYFTNTVDFDPSSGSSSFNSVGSYDIFIQKLDSSGNFVWAKQMGGTSFDEGLAITTDLNGNVYTTGYFKNVVDFDPNAGVVNLTATNTNSIFIQKMDSNGNLVWVKQLDGAFGTIGQAIITDPSGNIYLAGNFTDTVDFDPNAGVSNLIAVGGSDGFVQKLDANGNLVWVKQMEGSLTVSVEGIDIDGAGGIYLTGSFTGVVDFDPGTNVSNLTSMSTLSNDADIFVQKLANSGQLIWVKQMGGLEDDRGYSIATDNYGNVYTTGLFENSVDFNPNPTGNNTFISNGVNDIFVQKLDLFGDLVWARQMGGTGVDAGLGITVDQYEQAYITGQFSNTVDFDPGTSTMSLTSTGNRDIFIQKLDINGNLIWVKQMGDTNFDSGQSIALGNNENIYSNGSFSNSVDFDPSNGSFLLTAAGFTDVYVQSLSQPVVIAIDDIESSYIHLYPNPSSSSITIELEQAQKATITILDQKGALVHPILITDQQQVSLDLEHLPTSIYYISIQTKEKTTVNKWIKK